MSAVSGTRRAIKELVDGTVRVQIDIDPRFRRQFFELFPDIDMAVALAPLIEGKEPSRETDAAITEAATEAVKKGGELAKLAGILCSDPKFQEWIGRMSTRQPPKDVPPQERAAILVRRLCGVESRADLDHNAVAAEHFHLKIRKPWLRYCQGEAGNCA